MIITVASCPYQVSTISSPSAQVCSPPPPPAAMRIIMTTPPPPMKDKLMRKQHSFVIHIVIMMDSLLQFKLIFSHVLLIFYQKKGGKGGRRKKSALQKYLPYPTSFRAKDEQNVYIIIINVYIWNVYIGFGIYSEHSVSPALGENWGQQKIQIQHVS